MLNRVGEFEKVSYEQFYSAMKDGFFERLSEVLGTIDEEGYAPYFKKMYEEIVVPKRSTKGSAGYDFRAPFSFTLPKGATIKIPTGIRVKIDEGWWLSCLPRSSYGFKYRAQLDNTIGVIDSDYYNSDNEGHIFVKITNDSKEDKTLSVEAGDAFVQAIFIPYGVTYSDNATGVRNGGMGSTDTAQ